MTGRDVAEALLSGPVTEIRCRKAARHLGSERMWQEFLEALTSDQRDVIGPQVERWRRT
jgi:hypothetical protein